MAIFNSMNTKTIQSLSNQLASDDFRVWIQRNEFQKFQAKFRLLVGPYESLKTADKARTKLSPHYLFGDEPLLKRLK